MSSNVTTCQRETKEDGQWHNQVTTPPILLLIAYILCSEDKTNILACSVCPHFIRTLQTLCPSPLWRLLHTQDLKRAKKKSKRRPVRATFLLRMPSTHWSRSISASAVDMHNHCGIEAQHQPITAKNISEPWSPPIRLLHLWCHASIIWLVSNLLSF